MNNHERLAKIENAIKRQRPVKPGHPTPAQIESALRFVMADAVLFDHACALADHMALDSGKVATNG